jgi:hypothetical protein
MNKDNISRKCNKDGRKSDMYTNFKDENFKGRGQWGRQRMKLYNRWKYKCENWIELAHDRVKWLGFVNPAMKLRTE